MNFTTDKLRSLVRKWQTLIEAHVDVKTTDNYSLRMFCIGFTKRRVNQVKRTCYAQSSQIRQVCVSILIFPFGLVCFGCTKMMLGFLLWLSQLSDPPKDEGDYGKPGFFM